MSKQLAEKCSEHRRLYGDSRLATEVKDAHNVTGTCVWRHQNVCSTSATY